MPPAAPGSSSATPTCSRSSRSPASRCGCPSTSARSEANLLVPLYAVIAALALSLGWRLLAGDTRSRELGPVAWPLAAFVLWTGALARLDARPEEGRHLPRGVRAAVRTPRDRLRTTSVARPLADMAVGRPRRHRRRVCDGRRLPVGDARRLLEPQRHRRQRLRAVLPCQLGLLGPVHLRPLPRRRDPRHTGRHPARGRPRPPQPGALRRRRGNLVRAGALVLAVELRGARGRCRRRGCGRLGTSRRRRARRPRGDDRRVSRLPFRRYATRSWASPGAG